MITYKYKCKNCDFEFEVQQKILDDKLKDCAECSCKNSLERLVFKSNFILKGNGWTK